MKTTLVLPDPLMRRVKIRAASEGRKLKEVIADLLEKGMNTPSADVLPEGELPYVIHPKTGMAVSRTLNIPGFVPPTPEDSPSHHRTRQRGGASARCPVTCLIPIRAMKTISLALPASLLGGNTNVAGN